MLKDVIHGKSHLQHGMSRNSIVPFRGNGAFESIFPTGWDEIENYENYLDCDTLKTEDFYGFGEIELAIDHGARISGHHLLWALNKGANKDDILVEYDAGAPGGKRSCHWWQIYQPPYADEYHSTSFVAERTIDHIRTKSGEGNPWLIWSSFPDPHHPPVGLISRARTPLPIPPSLSQLYPWIGAGIVVGHYGFFLATKGSGDRTPRGSLSGPGVLLRTRH